VPPHSAFGLAFGHGVFAGFFDWWLAGGGPGFAFAGDRDAGNACGDTVHAQGVALVVIGLINQAIRLQQSSDPDAISKAAALYDTGTKMESRANKEIIELIRNRPR
jgi:hypothetical protein